MTKYGYLVVEGPHDIEFAYRLLSSFGVKRIKKEKDLDPFFRSLVPPSFPHKGDLQARVPVPLFLQSETHAIAVHSARGDSRLAETVEETGFSIDYEDVAGIGILLDTDKQIAVDARYASLKTQFSKFKLELPENPGTISGDAPRLGAYVLPDNASEGNLEDLLIECAGKAFPSLLANARTFVDAAKADVSFVDKNREDLSKVPHYNKAIVGAIATTLRPGRAVQNSIQDNIWLRGENLKLTRIKAVQDFLVDLFELTRP